MTTEQFKSSLTGARPPANISPFLQALWYDARGDWNKAHDLVQDINGNVASHIHAYLHRKEGDLSNARYWYQKASREMPAYTLQEEWEEIVNGLL